MSTSSVQKSFLFVRYSLCGEFKQADVWQSAWTELFSLVEKGSAKVEATVPIFGGGMHYYIRFLGGFGDQCGCDVCLSVLPLSSDSKKNQ